MKLRHCAPHSGPLTLVLATALTLSALAASASFASQKSVLRGSITPHANKTAEAADKSWNPLAGRPPLTADVPETEPNDTLVDADPISCGDIYHPAAIGVADDIDFMVMSAHAGDLLTLGTNSDGTTGQLDDTIIGLFDDAGGLLASDDDSGPALYSLISNFPAPYSGTYYVAVIAFDQFATGAYRAFVSCIAAPPPPINDTCAGAPRLPCKQFAEQGTTAGAQNDYTPVDVSGSGCTGFTANGNDIVYQVVLPDGGTISLDYTSAADGSVYLLNACVSPAFAACVAGSDQTLVGETEHLTYTNSSGSQQTLYLVLDSFGLGSFGAFTLAGTVSCPPVPVEPTTWGLIKARFRQ